MQEVHRYTSLTSPSFNSLLTLLYLSIWVLPFCIVSVFPLQLLYISHVNA